jgi:ribose transport system ATP-binding protein
LTKLFGGVAVLDGVDLTVHSGEIHALVGANGSGKSTLIKILSGYHVASSGSVTAVPDPQAEGVREPVLAFLHQDLGLVESMSVLENVALTCGYTTSRRSRRIRWRSTREEVRTLLSEFGLGVQANSTVGSLGATDRRLVAIARAAHSLGNSLGVLVLDEPTAELARDESHRVFEVMSLVAKRGAGVLFASHDLADALLLAQTVTVLRDGRVVARVQSESSTVEDLVAYMFGAAEEALLATEEIHKSAAGAPKPEVSGQLAPTPAIRLSGLYSSHLKNVNLDVWPGEVVGVTGLVGCGKSELGRVIAGAQTPVSGTISVFGDTPTRFASPHSALAVGVAYVPPDRRRFGGVLTMDARENVTLSTVSSFFQGGWLRKQKELNSVADQMVEVGAVPHNPRHLFGVFSGGNQQKLVFARALRIVPRVVVLDEPTHGVDVATIPELFHLVREMSERGCGVVLITSDLDELVALSDRIIVLVDGQLTEELRGKDVTAGQVDLAIARGRRERVH